MKQMLIAIAGTLIGISCAAAEGKLKIAQLTVVSGQAEVVDAGALNVYNDRGITRIGLMRPARSEADLRQQLTLAVTVKCLMFGDAQSAACHGVDAFGARWRLGGER